MTARVVTESYDGSSIAVDTTKVMGRSFVSVNTHEFNSATDLDAVEVDRDTLVYLTAVEAVELVAALNATLVELATQDTRSSASPVADDRGGGHGGPSAAVPASIDPTSILSGLSIAEITAARLAADPASATVPFEAGGALHVADRCGCSDCEDAYARIAAVPACIHPHTRERLNTAVSPEPVLICTDCFAVVGDDENARAVAAVLGRARAELLANSTAVRS